MLKDRVEVIKIKLKARGIESLRVDAGSDLIDPVIWITESIYIQVGMWYIVIFKDRPTGLSMYEASMNINDIIFKLKQAINEDKENMYVNKN